MCAKTAEIINKLPITMNERHVCESVGNRSTETRLRIETAMITVSALGDKIRAACGFGP